MTDVKRIRVGIAGWSNPPTVRAARQPDKTHLAYYADHFSCVEINSSFHRPLRASTYARWRDETPAQFRFSVKMPRTITHECHLRGAKTEVTEFYREISSLQPKLKVILIQLPPSLEFNATTVRSFFKALPRLYRTVVTCEPRHESWFSKRAEDALHRVEVTRVAADPARCVGANVPGGEPRFAYFRWHGAPHMYYSKYSDEQLASLALNLKAADAKDAWCMFDNTARHGAWDDALRLLTLLRAKKSLN